MKAKNIWIIPEDTSISKRTLCDYKKLNVLTKIMPLIIYYYLLGHSRKGAHSQCFPSSLYLVLLEIVPLSCAWIFMICFSREFLQTDTTFLLVKLTPCWKNSKFKL